MITNPSSALVGTQGIYAGNDTVDRAIPHGLGRVPVIVMMTDFYAVSFARIHGADPITLANSRVALHSKDTVTAMDDVNFYVGDASNYIESCNAIGSDYRWAAL